MVPRFRGRNIETGEWVYGHLFYFGDGRHFISPTGTDVVGGYGGAPAKYRLENLVCFEIKPETMGQSTGLKDKNGVEIYCGDAVEWLGHRGIVEFVLNNQQTMIIGAPGYITDLDYSTDFNTEVIGNIHENPKILGQTNEI